MRIPQIRIHQQYAKIKISTKAAKQQIHQEAADLEIKQARGKLTMHHRDVKVEIDNYPAWYDLGFRDLADFSKESVELGKEAVLKSIAKYARQGDQLMRLDKKGNPLRDMIIENSTPEKKEIGLKWKRGPKFNVIPGKLDINYQQGKPEISVKLNKPQLTYQAGRVDIRMAQYSKVEIDLPEHYLDQLV